MLAWAGSLPSVAGCAFFSCCCGRVFCRRSRVPLFMPASAHRGPRNDIYSPAYRNPLRSIAASSCIVPAYAGPLQSVTGSVFHASVRPSRPTKRHIFTSVWESPPINRQPRHALCQLMLVHCNRSRVPFHFMLAWAGSLPSVTGCAFFPCCCGRVLCRRSRVVLFFHVAAGGSSAVGHGLCFFSMLLRAGPLPSVTGCAFFHAAAGGSSAVCHGFRFSCQRPPIPTHETTCVHQRIRSLTFSLLRRRFFLVPVFPVYEQQGEPPCLTAPAQN
jgi:hypothetical protein